MASETAENFMRVLQETEQTRDIELLIGMFTEDAELINLATEPLRGREGARHFWSDYLSAFDRIRSKFTNGVEGEDAAVLEWISEGTLSKGEALTYRGVRVVEIHNGQVQGFRTYYDSAVFFPQGAKK